MADDRANGKSQDMIEENLKKVYRETLDEEIPERFRSLLDKLREKEGDDNDASAGARMASLRELIRQEAR